ncbi:MAG: histidine kinase [Okeania sp. SIO3B3]|nr:histidine kinase [Okeania sp. SIO3B3]
MSTKIATSTKVNDYRIYKILQANQNSIFTLLNKFKRKKKLIGVGNILKRLSIAQKFGYSYAVALGVAVIGIIIGLVVSEYYEKQALQTLNITDEQSRILNDLEKYVLGMKSHPQNLVPVLAKKIWFDFEKAKFLGYVSKVGENLEQLAIFIDKYPDNLAVETEEYQQLLESYQRVTDAYVERINLLWEEIDPGNLNLEEIPQAQQRIVAYLGEKVTTQIDVKFDRLSQTLTSIVRIAEAQESQAHHALNQAIQLKTQIIIISILTSLGVAIFLAIYISRVIANPLKQLSEVSQQVIHESNFQVQATVNTEDEVGLLAISLNQLILWVGEYTKRLQQTQLQLIQTEKMSSLGKMVGGVAHEINNPVSFIYGNIEYAEEYVDRLLELVRLYQQHYPQPDSEIQDYLEEVDVDFLAEDFIKVLSSMKTGAERIKQIVLSLKNFSHLDESGIKFVNLQEGIENTLVILNDRLRAIKVVKNYGELSLVECYPAKINQVFLDIILNSIDAVNQSESQFQESKIDFVPTIKIQTEKIDGDRVKVSFWNNGPVIPSNIIKKLFDPFFTTKPVGQGRGLGLTNCYQIIQQHCGKIEVISNSEQGTEFTITLPTNIKSG